MIVERGFGFACDDAMGVDEWYECVVKCPVTDRFMRQGVSDMDIG